MKETKCNTTLCEILNLVYVGYDSYDIFNCINCPYQNLADAVSTGRDMCKLGTLLYVAE